MAGDRGRDLKISILSDADRFDLAHPADELDDLAAAAKGAGSDLAAMGDDTRTAGSDLGSMGSDVADTARKVDQLGNDVKGAGAKLSALGTDTKAAGSDVDALGTDTKAAADKIDTAFDAIARSSKQNLGGGMKAGAADAKGALKDVGAEATGTARETAASFDGTADSVADSFQEISANALGALGPVGAAIGLAGAFGMGILRAQAEKTKAAISELVGSIIDQGGKLDRSNVLATLKTFAQDGTLLDLKRQAEEAKVPVNDFLLAMAGDPDAMERTTAAVMAQKDALTASVDLFGGSDAEALTEAHRRLDDIGGALVPVSENYAAAADAAGVYAAATGSADAATSAFSDTVAGWGDSLGAYTDTLATKEAAEQVTAQATADATTKSTDSWQDYVAAVDVSVAEYLATLLTQVTAQETWEANMTTLAAKVSTDTLAELARMGPEGAPLVAELATASDAELAKLDKLLARRAKSGVDSFAAGIDAGADDAEAAAGRVRDKVGDVFHRPIQVKLELDTRRFYTDLGAAQARAQAIATERMRP